MTALAFLAALAAWALLVVRGVRRSKRQGNIMASTFRRRHSWRWWAWTAAGRPSTWIKGFPTHSAGIRVGVRPVRFQVRLPLALFPPHYKRTAEAQRLVEAKAAYARGVIDENEMERRIGEALA